MRKTEAAHCSSDSIRRIEFKTRKFDFFSLRRWRAIFNFCCERRVFKFRFTSSCTRDISDSKSQSLLRSSDIGLSNNFSERIFKGMRMNKDSFFYTRKTRPIPHTQSWLAEGVHKDEVRLVNIRPVREPLVEKCHTLRACSRKAFTRL